MRHFLGPTYCAATILIAIAVTSSCRNEPSGSKRPDADQTAKIISPSAEEPLEVAAGRPAAAAVITNFSQSLPVRLITDVSAALAAEDVIVTIDPSEDGGDLPLDMPAMIVAFRLSDAASVDLCAGDITSIEFFVALDKDANVVAIAPQQVELDDAVMMLLGMGDAAFCTYVEANFSGTVSVAGLQLGFGLLAPSDANEDEQKFDESIASDTIPPAASSAPTNTPQALSGHNNDNDNSNDNGNGNDNDNSNSNANDNYGNGNLNSNDNSGGNTNSNDNDNGNSNENDNTGGNTNENGNQNGNANDNDNDNGNANGNESGNANNNANENANANNNDNDNGNTNGNSNRNGNANDNSSGLTVLFSTPGNNSIDAGQPFPIMGGALQGWSSVVLTFSGNTSGLTISDFSVTHEGAPGVVPFVENVESMGDMLVVHLSQPIPYGGWTTIRHNVSGSSTRLGFLPGDVNGDRNSSPQDILALINFQNGVAAYPSYQTDTDRSGQPTPGDILRVIDLLNGAGEFPVFLGMTLPAGGGNGNGNDNGNVNGNDNGNANSNDNDNENTNGNLNDNGNANGNTNGNDNDNGNANGNLNDNDNDNDNDNGNLNQNGNANGNLNDNDNENGNANGNANTNDNGNSNGNDNDNGNENGNVNGNDNGNTNGNLNDNGNSNGNTNGNDNSSVCPDGDVRLHAYLSGSGSGSADYRRESDGRRRFELSVSGFSAGSHNITVQGVVVGQVNVGGGGSGGVDWDTQEGNFPSNFPNIGSGASINVGGQASGAFFLSCS